MKKYAFGFVVGVLVSGIAFVPILRHGHANEYQLGRNHARIDAMLEITGLLHSEFGTLHPGDAYETIYSIKSFSVVKVDILGVQTVRVIQ